MQKIAILGSGLIGTYVGLNLLQKHQVYFIGRSDRWKHSMDATTQFSTTSLDAAFGHSSHSGPIHAVTSILELQQLELDFLVVCVKRTGLQDAAKQIGEWAKTQTKLPAICTLMNGVDAGGELKTALMNTGLSSMPVIVEGMWPSNVVQTVDEHSNPVWHMGSSGACYVLDSERGRALADIFNSCGLECKLHPNMVGVQYGKLLMNLNNAVNALSGIPLRQELAIYGYRKILAKCMLEALHVYDRSNITPVSLTNLPFHVLPYVMLYAPSFFFNWLFPRVIQVDDKATSSMYEDLKAKRDTEIEYLQGEIVRLARLADVAVPYCEAVRARILECQTQRSGVPHLAAEDILNKVE
ncbi:hypothetical protein HDU91_001202 [Kappamyces sp. JEL0680]|nr:hypothetical protein HDU91_001202 [Kappamyces sp. JEL0680]